MDKLKSTVKTFRITDELSGKIDDLREIKNITLQAFLEEAIIDCLGKYSDEATTVTKLIKDNFEHRGEHMYIPKKYYALYNDLAIEEVTRFIKTGTIISIKIGGTDLIMIDASEDIYKKAELLAIKGNISSIMKRMRKMEGEFAKVKTEIKKIKQ